MKKLFLFMAMASATMFVSCSDDDSKSGGETLDPNAATAVVLTANVTGEIELGESVTFTVTDSNADVVTSSSSILVNDVEIDGATFTPDVAGTFTVKANHTNSNDEVLTSNEVVVVVTEPVVAEANSIFVNEMNYPVNTSTLVYWGGWAEDENATVATHGLWSYVMSDDTTGDDVYDTTTANNYIDVEMIVPIVDNSVALPTTVNASYLDFYEVYVNGTEVVATSHEEGTVVLGTFPTAIDMPHTFSVTSSYNAGSTLSVDFDGNWLGIIDTTAEEKQAPTSVTKRKFKTTLLTKEQVLKNKAKFFKSLKK